jgi:hypothetical protein
MQNKEPRIKTIETLYAVMVNDDVVLDQFPKIALAKKFVNNMSITEDIQNVKIIKQTVTHQVVKNLVPKVAKVLTVEDFNLEE